LRLIYRPHNLYCIHADAKSSAAIRHAVRAIASCFGNVFVASRSIDIHWGEFSLLEAELICLRELFERPEHWYYYVNLMGREFPLRTNRELVKIFKAYNGSNDVDGSFHRYLNIYATFFSIVRIDVDLFLQKLFFCYLHIYIFCILFFFLFQGRMQFYTF